MRLRLLLALMAILSLLLVFRQESNAPQPHVTRGVEKPPSAKPAVLAIEPTSEGKVAAEAASDDPMHDFTEWTKDYLATRNPDLISKGVKLAQERRPVFKQLITQNPREAIRTAVPMVVRQELPPEIVSLLEKRVNAQGQLSLRMGMPEKGAGSNANMVKQRRVVLESGTAFNAHVFGRREQTVSTGLTSLNGVAVDAEMAVSEEPSRRLEVGERPPAKEAVVDCPVSGQQVFDSPEAITEVITESTPAVETGGQVVFFCDGAHIVSYNDTLILGEGASGGGFGYTGILPNAPTPSLGVIKVLAIPMTFADQNSVPATEATIYETLRNVSDHYARASYGRLTLVGVVTPLVRLPHNEAWYINRDTSNGGDIDGEGLEHLHAREEARKMGYDSNDYDSICVRHSGGPGSYGGLATVPGSTVWLRTDSAGTWAHEIGHSFGLLHANFWETSGTSSIGPGGNDEYGHSYDIVGTSASFPNGHYNVAGKNQIRWLADPFVQTVTGSGLYRIHAQDAGVLDPSRRYALRMVKDAQRTYWGEVRSLFDSVPWIKNGLMLGWRYPNGSGSNLQLLDTTPGSPFLKEDAPIALGSTFSDMEAGIHMTTVGMTESPRSVDVQVNVGEFAGNQRPVLTLTASSISVPVNGTVTFTANATDADNDALAYSWQHFGDSAFKSVEPNAPVISRQFTAAGTYVVTCTVSDMKGGTAVRSQLITVGNGNGRFTIRGRVTLGGAGLQDVVVTANGQNGVITDADGYYVIPNLAANVYAVTPLLYGYTFEDAFNNPVSVGPSAAEVNFIATALPVVTLTAVTPTANELAPVTTGLFRLTRAGDTSSDLLVNVNAAQGTATKDTDYSLTPNYVTASLGFNTFTIPAGSATQDVVVTPLTDTTQEGPETVILQLGPGNGYTVAMPSTAMVTLDDDDTALPKVSITATANRALEGLVTPGVFTVSRTGATTAALTVNYAVSGSASSGADYTALGGSVTIPAGAASAVVNVVPVDDALSETLETVLLTLRSNASYLIDPALPSATVSLGDDDTQVVSLSVTDATAREVDLSVPGTQPDTGSFLVTRSGDTSASLTVFYAFSGVQGTGNAALHGVDFEALSGSVVIPAGETRAAITVVPRFDQIGEGPEQAVLHLGAASTNYVVNGDSSAQVTIQDSASAQPSIEVSTISNATEGSGTATFRLTLRGGSGTGSVTVNYGFTGTAAAGDFSVSGTNNTLTGTSITLNNGATVTKDITITATNDTEQEDVESLVLTLAAGSYNSYAATSTATMWLRDNDFTNTVNVTAQVGTGGSVTFTEGATTTPVRFYVSRTGSTSAALVVNYTLGGTATSGSDYTAPSGTVTISAGSLGANVDLTITNDTTVEGTESIEFSFAAGTYSRAAVGATIYIADNETPPITAAFTQAASAGLESTTSVTIPVALSAVAGSPVTVQYAVSSSTSSGTTSTPTPPHALPYWVRLVKTGNSITHFESNDGVFWTQRGAVSTVPALGTSYLAGLAVASGSTTAATLVLDSFSVTGLAAGGSLGAETAVNIGNAGPSGTHSVAAGVYTFTTPGSGIGTSATTDNFRFVHLPVTGSADCTITARVVSSSTTSASSRLGVMLRSTTANNAVYAASLASGAATSLFFPMNRTTSAGSSNNPSTFSGPVLPWWFRTSRSGDVFTQEYSKDGSTWTVLGTAQTLALGPRMLVGLAVSAASDGQLASASFDNVVLDGQPATGLLGRTVGFTNEIGSERLDSGVWSLTGSGAGISGNSDEAHFAAIEVNGNFTFSARLMSLTEGANGAQAGLMTRQTRDGYSRQFHAGFVRSGSIERRLRTQTTTSAYGSGIDFTLAAGTLTFAAGDTSEDIVLTVNNDLVDEPDNVITLQLLNPNGAALGSITTHGYTIIDDDGPPGGQPFVSFAAAASSVNEGAGSASLPVSLSIPSSSTLTVDYAVTGGTATGTGTDFTLASGTLSFAPGETVKSIPFTLVDDTLAEADETIIVTLSGLVGGQLGANHVHTASLVDNDTPSVTLTASDATAAESGDTGTFLLTRTGSTDAALTVNLAVSGTAASPGDYAALPGTATFAIGSSTTTVTVTPADDSANEGTETVILTLAAGSGYTLGSPNAATVSLADNDRSSVTVAASDAVASETSGNTGTFLFTRSSPTTAALTVTYAVSGSASSGSDFTSIGTTVTFAAGSSTASVTLSPVNDSNIEGEELVTLSLQAGSGSYAIGTPSDASITIADNDQAPNLYISSPGLQSTLVATGNGIILQAITTDDGLPAATTVSWAQLGGPSAAIIESPNAATTAVTFPQPGNYLFEAVATDTQYTVRDQVTVISGPETVPADWLSFDLGPSISRRGQSIHYNGIATVTGTGAGYGTTAAAGPTSDQAHIMLRPAAGDGSITARLTSLSLSTGLAGISIRDSMLNGSRRAVLGYVPGSGLYFRSRVNAGGADALTASQTTGLAVPLWLRLQRVAATNEITASYAPDVAGSPGTWTQLGATTVIAMDATAHFGLTTTSNSTGSVANGVFDNIALTPAPTGPAVLSEDATSTPAGSGTLAAGTYTIIGSPSGYYHGWQYGGDLIATCRLVSFSSGAGSAIGGLRIAEAMDGNVGYAHFGRIPTGAYDGYLWRNFANGSNAGLPTGVSAGNWIRLIRKGTSITGYRATHNSTTGGPNAWTQVGQPQTVVMAAPVFVGFFVNNSTGVGNNTVTFSNFTVEPVNKAPVIALASVATWPVNPIPLDGTVTDDTYPVPVSLTHLWSKVSGPGTVALANAALPDTTATLGQEGAYTLRLAVDDGLARSFRDLSFTGYLNAFQVWQAQNWNTTGGTGDPAASQFLDPDFDGQMNLLEYAFGTAPQAGGTSPVVLDTTTVSSASYLRLSLPKNPAATDVTFIVEASSDLQTWSSAGLIIETNTANQLVVRDNVALTSGVKRFMRVRVTR